MPFSSNSRCSLHFSASRSILLPKPPTAQFSAQHSQPPTNTASSPSKSTTSGPSSRPSRRNDKSLSDTLRTMNGRGVGLLAARGRGLAGCGVSLWDLWRLLRCGCTVSRRRRRRRGGESSASVMFPGEHRESRNKTLVELHYTAYTRLSEEARPHSNRRILRRYRRSHFSSLCRHIQGWERGIFVRDLCLLLWRCLTKQWVKVSKKGKKRKSRKARDTERSGDQQISTGSEVVEADAQQTLRGDKTVLYTLDI